VADRLLEHDPVMGRHQAGRRQMAADRAEQVRRGRQIEDAHTLGIVQLGRQRIEAARSLGIDRDVAQPVEEAAEAELVQRSRPRAAGARHRSARRTPRGRARCGRSR
jgi:hypothetical protein